MDPHGDKPYAIPNCIDVSMPIAELGCTGLLVYRNHSHRLLMGVDGLAEMYVAKGFAPTQTCEVSFTDGGELPSGNYVR